MGNIVNNPHRLIRPNQETDKAEVVGVWRRSGMAAYTYLPTWHALTLLETAMWVFENVILPKCNIWGSTLDERIDEYMAMNGSYFDRLYIDPTERCKGRGMRFSNLAKQISPTGLESHTHQENLVARAIYERHGLVAVKFGISPPLN
jgi:hypothetical protein